MPTLTVCVTSPQPGNDRLAEMLRTKGVIVWQLPVMDYAAPSDHYAALDGAIDELSVYSIVVFTSTHAVSVFQDRLAHHGDAPIGHLKFAVVGESTAKRCAEYGFPVHFIPETATGRALGELLNMQVPHGKPILFPQAEEGREEFLQAMTAAGETVTVVPAYRTVPAKIDAALWKARMETSVWQALVVTSPKGLRTWMDAFGHAWCHEVMVGRRLFVMGATTAESAGHLGFQSVQAAPHATLESLADCIVNFNISFLRAGLGVGW